MSIGCFSVEYWPSVDRVRSVEYRASVDRVSFGRVSAECR